MNDNDLFEARIKRLVNDSVDADLGPRRPAPRFEPAPRASRRPAWLLPLAVAATVAIISGGAVGIAQLASGHKQAPATSGTPTIAPKPSPTNGFTVVRLGGARVAVPPGWTAKQFASGDSTLTWCLAPAGTSRPASPTECPLTFVAVGTPTGSQPVIDVDHELGAYGDSPQWCAPNGTPHTTVRSDERTVGGRTAEWRDFTITCAGAPNRSREIEQYVVPTDKSFVVYTTRRTSATDAALSTVVQHSVLPAQDRPLRLEDYGIVRSATKRANGWEISLDRVVEATGGNPEPATYDYLVPTPALTGQAPKVGTKVHVFTNGDTVIQCY